jgi:hypothetical protein
MLPPVLALLILAGYAFSLWWLLRGESARSIAWLVGLTGISVALRLVYTSEYPPGMNEDEVKVLWCAADLLRAGSLFVDDCSNTPALLTVLFPGQLAQILGPSRWAMRGLSFLGATLAVPAAFGAARSLGLRVAPSLAAAGFVAVLPWALFFGRVHQNGEVFFMALLVIAALACFLRGRGGWPEVVIGASSLTLLMQSYYSGRALVGVTATAIVLAPGRYRLYALVVLLLALAGYVPYYRQATMATVGLGGNLVQPGMTEDPLGTLERKTTQALRALVEPVASDGWVTIRSAAVHPPWILALAGVGFFALGVRRGLFLCISFVGCMAPAILGYGDLPSARRMVVAYPFLALAAAAALDLVPWRRVRAPLCAAVVAVTAVTSARYFFSEEFWPHGSRAVFDHDRWDVIESLPPPPHPPLIVTHDLGYFFGARSSVYGGAELLSVENWFPADHHEAIYVFGSTFAPLHPLYLSTFGHQRVRSFGHAFTVHVEAADWSWIRQWGWTYEARCGKETRTGQVPFLVLQGVGFSDHGCAGSGQHAWRGQWLGPDSTLRVYARGRLEIEVDGAEAARAEGWDALAVVEVRTGARLTVRVRSPAMVALSARLTRLTPAGEQGPFLEWVRPLTAAEP